MPVRPELIVFDMIGTTLAATDEVPAAFAHALTSAGMSISEGDLRRVRGLNKRDALRRLIGSISPERPETNALAERLYQTFAADLLERYQRRPPAAIAGAEDTLHWCRARGIATALTSGLPRDLAVFLLATLGWTSALVPHVVTADDVEQGRPAPDLIHDALRRAGVRDPRAGRAAGDTPADLQAARAAGAGAIIGVLSGAAARHELAAEPHDALLASVADLPAWIRAAPGPPLQVRPRSAEKSGYDRA
jgi:phosphonatase-like hydrolase